MIAYKDLGMILLFLLAIGVGIYLIMILIQVNAIVKNVRGFLDISRPRLDQTMDKLPIIAAKIDDAADDLKHGIGKSADALEHIGDTLTDTVDTLTDTVDTVTVGTKEAVGYLGIISEIVKIIFNTWRK